MLTLVICHALPCCSASVLTTVTPDGWRRRASLLQMASEHTMHMQKTLSQMNLQIHHVLSDLGNR